MKKHALLLADFNIEGTRNICVQANHCAQGHRSVRPRGAFGFQDRPGPEEYQHHRNHSYMATETASEEKLSRKGPLYQAIDGSTETSTALLCSGNQYTGQYM